MGQSISGTSKEVTPPVYFPKRDTTNHMEIDQGFLGQLRKEIVSMAPSILVYAVASWFVSRQVNKFLGEMNGNTSGKSKIGMRKSLSEKLKNPSIEYMEFNNHEYSLFDSVTSYEDIDATFSDVGGLDEEIDAIVDNVLTPMRLYHKFGTTDIAPSGLLLHGKPGTGKTLIARAIAKECQASFIYIQSSDIFDKFLGESEKRVTAIFSLADKLAPSIIFIDELETCLAKRGAGINSDLTNNVLGRFLSAWDGLVERTKPVVVLGATNRPEQLDPAVLRRLPIKLATKVPDLLGRVSIIQKLFKNELPLEDVTFEEIAASTEGYTGSDLKELQRVAGIQRLKRILNTIPDGPPRHAASTLPKSNPKEFETTPINKSDIIYALRKTASNDATINSLNAASNRQFDSISALSSLVSAIASSSKKSKSKSKKSTDELEEEVVVSDA